MTENSDAKRQVWLPITDSSRHVQLDRYAAVAILESDEGEFIVRLRNNGDDVDFRCDNLTEARKGLDRIVVSFVRGTE